MDDSLDKLLKVLDNRDVLNLRFMSPDGKLKGGIQSTKSKDKLKSYLEKYDGKRNIYFTLNPIKQEVLKERREGLNKGKSISDNEIDKYSLMLIDIDPKRKSKTSSNDYEYGEAKKLAVKISEYLEKIGVGKPIFASSGNGYHLILKADIDNKVDNVDIVKKFLKSLDEVFSNAIVKVDTTTGNPSRLTRFYGTKNCKGEDTEDRPRRRSEIISMGNQERRVTTDDLLMVIRDLKASKHEVEPKDNKYNLERVLNNVGIHVSHIKKEEDRQIYVLKRCPFNDEHTDKAAYIVEFDNGNIVAGCHHESCMGNDWNLLVKKYGIKYGNKNTDNIDNTDNKDKYNKKESQETILLNIVDKLEIRCTNTNEVYVKVDNNGSVENLSINSQKFKNWLILNYYTKENKMPSNENIGKSISLLQAKSMLSNNKIQVEKRCCINDNTIYYDLLNNKGEVVKINKHGWEIVTKHQCLFTSGDSMKSQVKPVEYSDLSILDKYFRYKDKNHLILQKVILVSLFIDNIQRPISVLHGEKGASKTTTMKLIREIVDPSHVPVTSISRNVEDLAITLSNQYLICFDNIDSISKDISDLLCMAVTGGGYSKRKLYTDSDEKLMYFQKGIVLNGINVVTTRPDLLDRSILMELERIPTEERLEESQLNKQIKEDMPKILGAIFTTLSKAMNIYDDIHLEKLGRLADFTRWGYAIAEVSGIGGEKFLDAYLNNQIDANYEAILSNPVGLAINKFIDESKKWEGTPTELLSKLNEVAEEENIDTSNRLWPKAPNVLSRRLNEIKSNLQDIGIKVTISKGIQRTINLSKI